LNDNTFLCFVLEKNSSFGFSTLAVVTGKKPNVLFVRSAFFGMKHNVPGYGQCEEEQGARQSDLTTTPTASAEHRLSA
jgi:hypothetical protein